MISLTPADKTEEHRRLYEAAHKAREKAYALQSDFKVGAAILNFNGQVYTGCNIENESLSLTNCAERVAIGSMIKTAGKQKIKIICCVSERGGTPCGACRQVIWEFCEDDPTVQILTGDLHYNLWLFTIGELLPYPFKIPSLVKL